MNSTANQVKQSAKTLAQQIAKQMAREPLEILKDVKEQSVGDQNPSETRDTQQQNGSVDQTELLNRQNELQDNMKLERLLGALNREIDDIRKQNLFKELQRRISEGEVVPLEEYTNLSMEQKQVLLAQMEAVKTQMLNAKYANDQFSEVPSIISKPSRRFGAGQKAQAQKEQTHVEKPVPTSG